MPIRLYKLVIIYCLSLVLYFAFAMNTVFISLPFVVVVVVIVSVERLATTKL